MNSNTYYMILVRYTSLSLTTWVPYIGETTGMFDWWNGKPKRFTTLEDAEKAVSGVEADSFFRDRCNEWRIVKVTTTEEVVKECVSNES